MQAKVTGDRGVMRVLNPIAPQFFNLIRVRAGNRSRRERVRGRATYDYQLEAFAAAVREGAPVLTGPEDIVGNMEVIDAIYTAAGLDPRKGATDSA